MSTLVRSSQKCILCGFESEFTVVNSTNAFGTMDLDTRPPEMKRSLLKYEIQECPHCHYANIDISLNDIGVRSNDLSAVAYLQMANDKKIDAAAKSFLLAGYLHAKFQHYREAGILYLKAAWIFDDRGDEAYAIRARKKSVENIVKSVNESEDLHLAVLSVDLFRRIGEFDQALEAIDDVLQISPDEFLVKILNFERTLIDNKDTRCHNVREVK